MAKAVSSPPTAAETPASAADGALTTVAKPSSSSPLTIYFVHPDLGIGGAERLVVDAAVGLQSRHHHHVRVFTSHHDRAHCFEETLSTLSVSVYGDFLPQSLLGGRGKIACAIVRSLYLALSLLLRQPRPDVLIVDQLSIALPLYALLAPGTAILFYCHYPDLQLASRASLLQRLYRAPFDALEQWSMSYAQLVMVNSHFTRAVYLSTFTALAASHPPPLVVYPSITFSAYDEDHRRPVAADAAAILAIPASTALFVSINRFERKKDIGLAIDAFAALRQRWPAPSTPPPPFASSLLILAGGFDPLNAENLAYVPELEQRCLALRLRPARYPSLDGDVVFLLSFSAAQRSALLSRALAVVYTPQREHFGIVPVEAMYARRVVIACDSGGPVESIEHGHTGFLCHPDATAFADAMERTLAMGEAERERMGRTGRERVQSKFGIEQFVGAFHQAVTGLVVAQRARPAGTTWTLQLLEAVAVFMMLAGVWLMLS